MRNMKCVCWNECARDTGPCFAVWIAGASKNILDVDSNCDRVGLQFQLEIGIARAASSKVSVHSAGCKRLAKVSANQLPTQLTIRLGR